MKKFSKAYKIGTKVQFDAQHDNEWYTIHDICETRKWIQVTDSKGIKICGSHQVGHIIRYTNN